MGGGGGVGGCGVDSGGALEGLGTGGGAMGLRRLCDVGRLWRGGGCKSPEHFFL